MSEIIFDQLVQHEHLNASSFLALSLAERATVLHSGSCTGNFNAALAEKRLSRWRSQHPFANGPLFAQRLNCDGLTESQFALVLGQSAQALSAAFDKPPDWIAKLVRCVPDAHYPGPADSNDIDLNQSTGFLNVVAPLVAPAREQLRGALADLRRRFPHAPFIDPAAVEHMLFANLHDTLRRTLTKTMVLEMNVARVQGLLTGETPEQRFWSYVTKLHDPDTVRAIVEEYPVLFRQLLAKIDRWVETSSELMGRLCVDWNEIRAQFCPTDVPGELTKIRAGSGTTRQGGRSVVVFTFESGFKALYKPKSLAVDVHFQDVLRWLNAAGAAPDFRMLDMLDRGDYGWVEWVHATACDTEQAVTRFYRRQGGYLAVMVALQATDFHEDNLIALGEHPVLIDLEALFHPDLDDDVQRPETALPRPASPALEQLLTQVMSHTVLDTGLLPEPVVTDDDADGYDTSGLTGAGNQLTPHAVATWDNLWTDEMKLVRKRVRTSRGDNVPVLNGEPVNALNYRREVVNGFESTYRLLLSHRAEFLADDGPLAQFANDEVRVMLHSNRTYSKLLNDSLHPDLLRDALERDRHFDRLWGAAEYDLRFTRVIGFEQHDLRAGDMPLFGTRPGSRHLYSSDGTQIADFFRNTGIDVARIRVERMGDEDLARQSWFVSASLATLLTGVHVGGKSPAPPALTTQMDTVDKPNLANKVEGVPARQMLTEACKVGDRLAQLAIQVGDEATWLGLSLDDDRHWSVGPLGIDLYNGVPGVALFLAHLGAITGEAQFEALARAAAASVRRDIFSADFGSQSPSGFNGLGGLIYTFAHLGKVWGERRWIDDADSLVARMPAFIDHSERLSVLDGVAGCLGGLITLQRIAPSDATLAMAMRCGHHLHDRLLPKQVETVTQPRTQAASEPSQEPAQLRVGFTHGLSGLSWALIELAAITGNRDFVNAGLAAMTRERYLLQRQTDQPAAKGLNEATWHDGAAGIGLARLSCLRRSEATSLDAGSRALIRADIGACVTTVLADGFGANQSLAHGDLGNIEFLAQVASELDDARLHAQVTQHSAHLMNGIQSDGWITAAPTGLETPGLMTGLAGIGWGMLRLIEPRHVPCVLTLDPGQDAVAASDARSGGISGVI